MGCCVPNVLGLSDSVETTCRQTNKTKREFNSYILVFISNFVLFFVLLCSVSLKDIKAWLNSVNFKISNNKLRKRYQVCVSSLASFCDKHFLSAKLPIARHW